METRPDPGNSLPGEADCANCIGTLSFPIVTVTRAVQAARLCRCQLVILIFPRVPSSRKQTTKCRRFQQVQLKSTISILIQSSCLLYIPILATNFVSVYHCQPTVFKQVSPQLGMGDTQHFVHGIYREKLPRYRVYRSTCSRLSHPK